MKTIVKRPPGSSRAIRVLLVAHLDLLLQGLKAVLQSEDGIEVVAEAKEDREACAKARALQPDVALVHTFTPDENGLTTTRKIRQESPQTHVLILTQCADQEHFQQAMAAGASGYELMDIASSHLSNAIRAVSAGKLALNQAVLKKMVEALTGNGHGPSPAPPQAHNLAPRAVQVLTMLTQGLSDKEIASRLLISEATVKSHLRIIYARLRVHNRAQATAFALQRGLVPPGTRLAAGVTTTLR